VVLYGLAESVLKTTYQLLKEAEPITPDDVCRAVGRPPGDRETKAILGRLYAEGYIGADGDVVTDQSAPAPAVIIATENGLERIRQGRSSPRQIARGGEE